MRILLCHRPGGAFGHISDSFKLALESIGCVTDRWDGRQESWERFAPDLFIGCSGHKQDIPANHGKCKVAIHVNPYCETKIEPNINESIETIKWVLSKNPDVVYGYGHENDRHYWGYWEKKHNIPWVPMATAADAAKYYPNFNKAYDIVYVGGRWAYKAKNIDKYLLPILYDGKLEIALGGWGGWPDDLKVTRNFGEIAENLVPMVIASGKVGPCISEPHTTIYGIDLPERMFKVALSGTLVIHDKVKNLKQFLPDVVMANDEKEFKSLIQHWVSPSMDDSRTKLARSQALYIAEHHTYFNRMQSLLKATGFVDIAQRFDAKISELKSSIDSI